MKTQLNTRFSKISAILIAALLSTQISFAQNDDYKMSANVHLGTSVTGMIWRGIGTLEGISNLDLKASPVFQIQYDYGLAKVFSIGVTGSFQTYGADYIDLGTAEQLSVNVNRTHFSIRPLLHYANSDKLDLYSGLRIGYIFNSVDGSFDDFSGVNVKNTSRLAIGLTAFGMRYYITDNIGISGELNFGAPDLLSGGLAMRF